MEISGIAAHAQSITVRPALNQIPRVHVDPISQNAQQKAIHGEYYSLNRGGEPGSFGIMVGLAGSGILYPLLRRALLSKSAS